jgi:hypothetical protein
MWIVSKVPQFAVLLEPKPDGKPLKRLCGLSVVNAVMPRIDVPLNESRDLAFQ